MKIRSMQTCIMSSLPRCIFRCSVFRYVTLVSFFSLFFIQTLLFNCNSFTLVANKYLLTFLLTWFKPTIISCPDRQSNARGIFVNLVHVIAFEKLNRLRNSFSQHLITTIIKNDQIICGKCSMYMRTKASK